MPELPVIQVSAADCDVYSVRQPLGFRFARAWNRWGCRGRGAVPRWIGRNCGRRWKLLCRTASGTSLAVAPGSLDVYLTILRDGSWEPWILQAVLATLRPDDVLYDIGANVGFISLETAAAMPIEIHAFEPQPDLAAAIAVSARLNRFDRLHVYATAVGDREGTIPLCLPGHSLHASIRSATPGERTIDVPLLTIDSLVASGQLPAPAMIKIDVEGAEFQVLRGARQTLQSHQPVLLFEVNDNAARFGYQKDQLLTWITDQADYRFLQVSPSDLLAAPRERADEIADQYPADKRPSMLCMDCSKGG